MPRYNDVVVNQAGHPVGGVAVTVTVGTSATLASLFSDALYTLPIANPVTSDGLGRIGFFVVPGDYTLSLVGGTPPITPTTYLVSVGTESGGASLQAYTGVQDGTNVTFTFTNTPQNPTSVQVFLNGPLYNGWTFVGNILTLPAPPASDDVLTVYF